MSRDYFITYININKISILSLFHAQPWVLTRYFFPALFHVLDKIINLLLRGADVCNINISRRTKGIPDHSTPVVYPFISVLSVGAGGGVSIQLVGYLLRRVSGTAHVQGDSGVQP